MVHARVRDALTAIVIALAAGWSLSAPAAGTTASGSPRVSPNSCPTKWTVVHTPSPGTYNRLESISGVSATDTWAAGAEDVALAIHWNGQGWSQAAVPSNLSYFNAVHMISSNDVWAGGYRSGSNAAHWNGSSWTAVDIAVSSGFLVNGIDAAASNDVWAVGWVTRAPSGTDPATAHWDGSAWTVVPSVTVPYGGQLDAVDVLGPHDVWAVGAQFLSDGFTPQPLIEHWDGVSWTEVSSPFAAGWAWLKGVSGASGTDVWTVGTEHKQSQPQIRTLIEHWDGSIWSSVRSVNRSGTQNELNAVMAVSVTEVWAVGDYFSSSSTNKPLLERWDGLSWQARDTATSLSRDYLFGVTVIGNVRWIVGRADPPFGSYNDTLAEVSCKA